MGIPASVETRQAGAWRSHHPLLGFGFGFAEAGDAVAVFPLIAFLEQFDAFEAFQNVALGAQSTGTLKTTMLSHKIGNFLGLPVRGTGLVPQAWMNATGIHSGNLPRGGANSRRVIQRP